MSFGEGTEARAWRVHGRVHGVGFRWWTRRAAEALGLVGTVRNRREGSVEVRAYGAADALGSLEERLRAGPPGARVDRLELLEPPRQRPPNDFTIAY